MASIHREIAVDAQPDGVWAAVRDFGAVHQRLRARFVFDARLHGDVGIVTLPHGQIAQEPLVDCDDTRRRLVYSVISDRVKHYNATVHVEADGEGTRVSWTVDVLPNEIAPYIAGQMDLAVLAMQKRFARGQVMAAP